MISAAILTHNDEKSIEECLKYLNFCDELIIIDDNSTDNTVELAKKFSARVIQHPLENDFAAQRNRLLEKAKNDWVLFIDTDERVTTELREEIKKIVQQPKYEVYYLKRIDYFWGKAIVHGELTSASNNGFIRLVKKGSGKWKGKVHETFVTEKTTGTLQHPLYHYPHPTVNEFITDINVYSSIRSKELYKGGKRPSVFELLFFPFGKFIYTYFLKLGFKDGAAGFVYAFMMSFHSFLVRAKLFQYQYVID